VGAGVAVLATDLLMEQPALKRQAPGRRSARFHPHQRVAVRVPGEGKGEFRAPVAEERVEQKRSARPRAALRSKDVPGSGPFHAAHAGGDVVIRQAEVQARPERVDELARQPHGSAVRNTADAVVHAKVARLQVDRPAQHGRR
jgi:hypothetical protein